MRMVPFLFMLECLPLVQEYVFNISNVFNLIFRFDMFYYFIHILCHEWNHLSHRRHHSSQIITPHLSYVHGLLDTYTLKFLPWYFAIDGESYIEFLAAFVVLLYHDMKRHSDHEPWYESELIHGKEMHRLHHKYLNCNFGFLFTFWDGLFETLKTEQ